MLLAALSRAPAASAQSAQLGAYLAQVDPFQQLRLWQSYDAHHALADLDAQDEQVGQKILLQPAAAAAASLAAPMSQASTQVPSELVAMRSRSDLRAIGGGGGGGNDTTTSDPYAASNLIAINPAQVAPADVMSAAGYFGPARPQQVLVEPPQVYGTDLMQVQMPPPPPQPPTMAQMDATALVHDQTMPVERYARRRKNYKQVDEPDGGGGGGGSSDDDRRSNAFYQELQHQHQQQPAHSQQLVQMTPSEQQQQQQQVAYMNSFGPMQQHPLAQFAPWNGAMGPAGAGPNYVPFDRPPAGQPPSYGAAQPSVAAASRPPMSLSNAQLMALIDELKEFNSSHANATTPVRKVAKRKKKKSGSSDQPAGEEDDDDDPTASDSADGSGAESSADADDEAAADNKEQDTASSKYDKQRAATGLDPNDKDDLAKFAKFLLTKEGANMRFQLNLDKDAPDDGDEEDDKDKGLKSRADKGKRRKSKKKVGKKETDELDDMNRKHSKASSQLDKLIEELSERAAELEREEHRRKERKRKHDNVNNKKLRPDAFSEPYRRARRAGRDALSGPRLKVMTEIKTIRAGRGPLRLLRSERGHFNNQPKRLLAEEITQDKRDSYQDANETEESRRPEKRLKDWAIQAGECKLVSERRRGVYPARSGLNFDSNTAFERAT